MLIEERHRAILAVIEEQGSITTTEIQRRFGVGYDSAKRDLRILEEKGLLKRTHGGAVGLTQAGQPSPGRQRMSVGAPESLSSFSAAKYAVSLIRDGDVIFLPPNDVGLFMAKNIPSELNISIAVNSLDLALELRSKPNVSVIFAGGGIDGYCCFDSFAVGLIERLRLDRSFICTDGVSPGFGLSVKHSRELQLWNALLGSSRQTVGVYSSDRLGKESVYSVCQASRLGCIITDSGADGDTVADLREAGIKVVIADNSDDEI